MSTSCEIGLMWVPQNTLDDKSALGHVMAWCCQAPSHYLSQSWPRSVSPYGLTKPQWVKKNIHTEKFNDICVFFAGLLYQWNQEPHTMCIFKWHWTLVSFLYPRSTKLKGVYWFHLVRPSVCLWTELCPLCIFYNTCQIHVIFTHPIKQLQKVCRVRVKFSSKLKILSFWKFFKFVTLTLLYLLRMYLSGYQEGWSWPFLTYLRLPRGGSY